MNKQNIENIIISLEKDGFLSWTKNVYKVKGAKVYLVGGALRDACLGRQDIDDYDFVVSGVELDKLIYLLEQSGKVNLVGRKFGVLKFTLLGKRQSIDIALPRSEVSFNTGGRRDFKIKSSKELSISDDVARRDFTINALAYEIKSKTLIDEFGGVSDIKNQIIRTVGDAHERFKEDYSRMLRAIRFACQLKFKIDNTTWLELVRLIRHINDKNKKGGRVVAVEIIASELLKAFIAYPLMAFDLYYQSRATHELMPELLKMKGCPQPKNWHKEGDVWEHTRLCLKNLNSASFRKRFKEIFILDKIDKNLVSAELVMAILWHDVGKSYTILTPQKDKVDRIRFNNHADEGAKKAILRFKKLRLSSVRGFSLDKVEWLISKHHLFDNQVVKNMKPSTVEKYFFKDACYGEDLLKLGFIDAISTIWEDKEKGNLDSFEVMVKRIEKLKAMGKGRKLPKAFIDGNDVMKVLKIKPSVCIKEILNIVREAQLVGEIKNKREALNYLKKI